MRPVVSRVAFLAALLLPLAVAAQAPPGVDVVGTVRAADGETLPGVNVYLSGTTRGAATDAQGRFRIENVPPGAYRLVASFIGYTAAVQDIRVRAGQEAGPFAIRLEASAVEGGEAVVQAEGDARWRRRYERFKKILLGESENAAQTDIENPWVLTFRDRFGELRATASAPLVIVNRALGYRLVYDLHAFGATDTRIQYDGDERFELLEPADASEAARWETARAIAYRGSLRHLLQAMRRGAATTEGFSFTLRRMSTTGELLDYVGRPISEADLTTPADSVETGAPGWYHLQFDGMLGVGYETEPEAPAYLSSEWFRESRATPYDRQQSYLQLTNGDPALVDPKGTPADPFAISASGYLAFERLGDLVPEEYVPPTVTTQSQIQARRPPRASGAGRDR